MTTNPEMIRAALFRWNAAMKECDARMDQLAELSGPVVESPLGNAVYGLMGEYTKTVAEMIGWDHSTLEDWWCSNNFGERPMKIGFSGEELRSIDSIEALADFIIDDLRMGE